MFTIRRWISRKRAWLWIGLLAGASAAAHGTGWGRPNVLLILADDLGYGDLSSYGAKDLHTPNIDRLMARGMRLDRFYANCPVCSPTRAALLSGRYPDLVGVPGVIRTHPNDSWGWLAPTAKLLPAVLKQVGYHTALVGKWHLGLASPNLPNERGFDHFHGFLGDMMDDYYTHRRWGHNYLRLDDQVVDPQGHATDVFTQWAVDYLNRRRHERPAPFFLYLAYNAPHTPIQPPPDWLAKVRAREPGITEKRAKLVALIEHLDAGIGRVLAALEANGQAENTLVLFTSDNGGLLAAGANNGPLRGGKQDMYEGGIRVPFCAVWPGRIPPGRRSSQVALTMDLFATVVDAAGAPMPKGIEAVSLLPMLLGDPHPLPARDLVWMRREGNMRYRGRDYFALRRGDWKLVQNSPFEPYQLFNLVQDPREQTDLSAREPKRMRALTRALMDHILAAGRVPWQAP